MSDKDILKARANLLKSIAENGQEINDAIEYAGNSITKKYLDIIKESNETGDEE